MSNGNAKRSHVRIAAAILAAIVLAAVVFTYLSYTAAFTPTDTVTVTSPRAGLVMERDAKVKYRGIQVGNVKDIEYAGDEAKLTLLINRNEMRFIPSNATVRIAGNTIFGAKSVEFLPPDQPQPTSLRNGAIVAAKDVQLEVNTLFQTLSDVLNKIDPVNLNATLSALGEGLRGNGDNLGAAMAGLNTYLQQLNPKLPTLQDDFAKAAVVANIYGDAGPDLAKIIDNVPTLNKTIVDEQDNLNATLLAATGLANNGTATLGPAADNYIAAIQRLRAPLKVAGDYS
ncbi:MCE family protein, partial [Mycolicibacterium sp.]